MPSKLKRPCLTPGCPNLTHEARCPKCKTKHSRNHDARRGSAHARGYTYRWQKYAARFKRQYPLCGQGPQAERTGEPTGCLERGIVTAAREVDHITPVSQGGEFWDSGNHQSLCRACHSSKTLREQRHE